MSTQNLLTQAVQLAGEEISPMLGSISDHMKEVEAIPVDLRTESEMELLKVAKAFKRVSAPLLNLTVAIQAGGVREDGYPKLAIASYDMSVSQVRVHTVVHQDGSLEFNGRGSERWEMEFQSGTMPQVKGMKSWAYPLSASAVVPLVPPSLRQKDYEDLVLLFEVADWDPEVRAIVDPYLLKKVAGDIYAVVATWDITKLELQAYNIARKMGISS